MFRKTGLSLEEIRKALDSPDDNLTHALEQRLEELNEDLKRIRDQQRFILGILKNRRYYQRIKIMSGEKWVSLLSASGFTSEDMLRWRAEFERLAPDKRQEFLEFLCFSDDSLDASPDRSRLKCPTLIIAGEHDTLMGGPVARHMKDAIGNAELEILPTGHASALEAPERFNRLVLDFMEGIR